MAGHELSTGEQGGEYAPNYELFYRDVIHEDNWPGYAALDFEWLDNIDSNRWRAEGDKIIRGIYITIYGVYNVFTGDAWDEATGRAARDQSGVGVYSHPEGPLRKAASHREHREQMKGAEYDWFGELVKTNREVIREDTWAGYEAQGFVPITDEEQSGIVRFLVGLSNMYTGEPWDEAAGHPSRDRSIPGTCVYTSPRGLLHMAELQRKDRENQRLIRQLQSPADGDTNTG